MKDYGFTKEDALDISIKMPHRLRHLLVKYGSVEAGLAAEEEDRARVARMSVAQTDYVRSKVGEAHPHATLSNDDEPEKLPPPRINRKRKWRRESKIFDKLSAECNTQDIEDLMRGYVRDSSISVYMTIWRNYLIYAGSKDRALDPATLREWIRHAITQTNLSRSTIMLRMAAVKSVIRYLSRNGRLDKARAYEFSEVENLPSTALPNRGRSGRRVRLTTDDVRRMVRLPNASRMNPAACQERALLYVFATTGMRISEVVAIKTDDIVQRGPHYVVTNIMGKGQGEAREAPISRDAVDAINDWLYVRPFHSDYVFATGRIEYMDPRFRTIVHSGPSMDTQVARTIIKRHGAAAGIPDIQPHDLRRYVGTQLAKKDIRMAQRVLGHKSINTTATHYVLDDTPVGVTEDLA